MKIALFFPTAVLKSSHFFPSTSQKSKIVFRPFYQLKSTSHQTGIRENVWAVKSMNIGFINPEMSLGV